MHPGDEERQAYAKEQLTAYLVAKGIDPHLARSVVDKHVTQFIGLDLHGVRHLMVLWDHGEITQWPTFNRGCDNPHNNELGDALWLEAQDEMRRRQRRQLITEELGDDDSPYLEDHDPQAAQRRKIESTVRSAL